MTVHFSMRGMRSGTLQAADRDALTDADVKIGGSHPWDISIRDDRLYQRVLSHGSMGLGESYAVRVAQSYSFTLSNFLTTG